MLTVLCETPGKLVAEQRPRPLRQPGEVLLRVRRVGVCGTDLHIFTGNQPYLAYPRVMGHELSGVVEEADPACGLAPGDAVYVMPYLSCGRCIACRQGKTNCCTSIQVLGVHRDGAMTEATAAHEPDLRNGERMFWAGGCTACHAPEADRPLRLAGGAPLNAGDPQLFRSTDGAITWQPVAQFPAPLSPFGGSVGNTITSFAIDRNNPSRLYAGFAFPDYLMRSEDAGATWTRMTSGLGAGEVTSIAFDPANAGTLYVSQSGSGVFRSTDLGATWIAIDAGLGDELISKLQVDTFNGSRLYASTASGIYSTQLSTGLPAGSRRAIEFYHASFNHYFISADNDEVAGLDAGVFQGWARTGEAFRVTEETTPGSAPVCRFFSVGFAPLSTHFYTPYPQECEGLKTNPAWLYERIAFGLMLPDAPPSRGCRAGTRALYRLWNRNLGGAPNHRYTTSPFTFGTMQGLGWQYEGEFPTRVFACVPYS